MLADPLTPTPSISCMQVSNQAYVVSYGGQPSIMSLGPSTEVDQTTRQSCTFPSAHGLYPILVLVCEMLPCVPIIYSDCIHFSVADMASTFCPVLHITDAVQFLAYLIAGQKQTGKFQQTAAMIQWWLTLHQPCVGSPPVVRPECRCRLPSSQLEKLVKHPAKP